MVIFSHPIGNANVRAATCGIAESGNLYKFETSLASFPGSILDTIGTIGPLKEIRRRRFDSTLQPYTNMYPWFEVGRMLAAKLGLSSLIRHEAGPLSIDAVFRRFDEHVAKTLQRAAKEGVSSVYAYEDASVNSFREAKRLGLQRFYDLPIGYWRTARKLLSLEREQRPEWSQTLTGFRDSEEKLTRKDEELSLANKIFVASTFTKKSLLDFPYPLAAIEVIPYGFPPVSGPRYYSPLAKHSPLKLLYVGGLSQRKGIAYLFEAVDRLGKHVELTIVGSKGNAPCPALDNALVKHRWIPSMPHEEILQLMRVHDVLVFPSLFEGFGLVITEAMSQGTPVITTERTAGPDLIDQDKNGWLVEAGSTEALLSALEAILVHPETVSRAGQEAMHTASQRPWQKYGWELSNSVTTYLSSVPTGNCSNS